MLSGTVRSAAGMLNVDTFRVAAQSKVCECAGGARCSSNASISAYRVKDAAAFAATAVGRVQGMDAGKLVTVSWRKDDKWMISADAWRAGAGSRAESENECRSRCAASTGYRPEATRPAAGSSGYAGRGIGVFTDDMPDRSCNTCA